MVLFPSTVRARFTVANDRVGPVRAHARYSSRSYRNYLARLCIVKHQKQPSNKLILQLSFYLRFDEAQWSNGKQTQWYVAPNSGCLYLKRPLNTCSNKVYEQIISFVSFVAA